MVKINYFYFVLYIILVSTNVYYGIKNSNKHIVARTRNFSFDIGKLLFLLSLGYLLFLASLDKNNPDYYAYYKVYNGELDYDFGFNYIKDFFVNRGFDYQSFRFAIFAFSYILISIFFFSIKINGNAVLALYSIYPFFYDAIQLRNLLAFSIVLVFLPRLIKKEKMGVILYSGAVIIASTIHRLSLIYLLLLLLVIKDSKIKRRILISVFSMSIVFLVLCKLSSVFYSYLLTIFGQITTDIRSYYYQRDAVHWGFLLYILMESLYLISAYFSNKAYKESLQDVGGIEAKYSELILQINIIMSTTFPVFLITAEFYRIFRNIALINYFIPVINLLYLKRLNKRKNTNILLSNTAFVFGFLINWLYQTNVDGFNRVFWVFFDNA